jgi:sugar phosphate permease
VVPAELFPLRARGKASALTTACHAASALLDAFLLKIWLANGYDTAAGMLVFAAIAIVMGLLAFVAMPETKGTAQ